MWEHLRDEYYILVTEVQLTEEQKLRFNEDIFQHSICSEIVELYPINDTISSVDLNFIITSVKKLGDYMVIQIIDRFIPLFPIGN